MSSPLLAPPWLPSSPLALLAEPPPLTASQSPGLPRGRPSGATAARSIALPSASDGGDGVADEVGKFGGVAGGEMSGGLRPAASCI